MFDIFNIRKCREMRDEIESLTVRLSNEHRKYEKAKERLESAEVDIYNLKLERNNLSDENENLRKQLAEEVGKNDEHSRMVNTLNADLEKVQHSLDESIARRDELARAADKLKAEQVQDETCAKLFTTAVMHGTKFAEDAYNNPKQKKMRYCGRISEDVYKLIKKFCKKQGVTFRWTIELATAICIPIFDASVDAVEKRKKQDKGEDQAESEAAQ